MAPADDGISVDVVRVRESTRDTEMTVSGSLERHDLDLHLDVDMYSTDESRWDMYREPRRETLSMRLMMTDLKT